MKSLAVLGIVVFGVAFCLPFDVVHEFVVQKSADAAKEGPVVKAVAVGKPEKKDTCGEITSPLKKMKLNIRRVLRRAQAKPEEASTFGCQFCLDLVDIAKTYEECDEAEVEHKLDSECDKEFPGGGAGDKACRGLVDGIMDDMIDKTEDQNAPAICSKRLNQECKYALH